MLFRWFISTDINLNDVFVFHLLFRFLDMGFIQEDKHQYYFLLNSIWSKN